MYKGEAIGEAPSSAGDTSPKPASPASAGCARRPARRRLRRAVGWSGAAGAGGVVWISHQWVREPTTLSLARAHLTLCAHERLRQRAAPARWIVRNPSCAHCGRHLRMPAARVLTAGTQGFIAPSATASSTPHGRLRPRRAALPQRAAIHTRSRARRAAWRARAPLYLYNLPGVHQDAPLRRAPQRVHDAPRRGWQLLLSQHLAFAMRRNGRRFLPMWRRV